MDSRSESHRSTADPCASVRELISAALDGETSGDEEVVVERHLRTCDGCLAYRDDAAELRRRLRLRPHTTGGAAIERLLADLNVARLGRGGWTRPVLAWCGLVIAAQSYGPLILGHADGAPAHVARHVGASGIALACGLLYAAWRPRRAYGLLPFVGALCIATVVAGLFDTLDGQRPPTAESAHLAEIIGTVVLWLVAGSPGWGRLTDAVRPRRHGRGVLRSTR